MTDSQTIASTARGWARYGFLPSMFELRNWGCQGCARWAIVLTFSGRGDQDTFITECDTHTIASAEIARLSRRLDRAWTKARAERDLANDWKPSTFND
jgi:hypothetical protein